MDSILERLRLHYLKGCIALCDLALDSYARRMECESLSEHERWEAKTELDMVQNDRYALQLIVDLLERKRREESGLPSFLPPE